MWWLLKRSEYNAQKGEGNKAAMRARVDSGEVPGLLGYLDGAPVAWCAMQPHERYPVLARSKLLAPVDELPVWSVVCLFMDRRFRRRGLTVEMLKAAVRYAGEQGVTIIEGYPVEPRSDNMPAAFAWTSVAAAFRKTGFAEVARRSEGWPIMRCFIQRVTIDDRQ